MTEQLCRLDIRISPQDKTLLKRRCEEFGMTQTDYMRMLINLPLRLVDEGMEEESDLFVITENGDGKRTGISEYPIHHRGGKGVYTINGLKVVLK